MWCGGVLSFLEELQAKKKNEKKTLIRAVDMDFIKDLQKKTDGS